MVLVDHQTTTSGDGMMREKVVNDPRGEVPRTLPLKDPPPPPASPSRSMAIGQFFKRIRTRSKSPAAKKLPPNPIRASTSSEAWPAVSNGHSPRRQISSQYSASNTSHFIRSSQDSTPELRNTPTRSSSRNRLRNWLNQEESGKLSHWLGSRLSSHGKEEAKPKAAAALRDQAQRGALSEEDLVSKSLASEIQQSQSVEKEPPKENPMLTSYYSQDSVFDGPQKVPSYVRVSCALNGYRRYRPPVPSPLSGPAGLTAPYSAPDKPWTPKGQSIVERRLERFNNPQPPSSAPPASSTPRVDGSTTGSSVRKLVEDFDRANNSSTTLSTDAIALTGQSQTEEDGSLLAEVLKATEQLMLNDGGGEKFLTLAAAEREKLETAIREGEAELADETIPPEGADLIRLAYGKARLLLSKKFSKFEELIQKNLNPIPDDPQPALLEDLEGYWQLVLMEVNDVNGHFNAYYAAKASNWAVPAEAEQNGVSKPKPVKAKKPPLPPTGPNKEARERLRAAKLDAKKRMMAQNAEQQQNGAEETQMFIPV